MLKIPQNIITCMIRQAEAAAPLEACGYFGANAGVVAAIFPMTNVDKSAEHFSFDPKEQFVVIKKARAQGLKLAAVYHSHPGSPARLSAEDLRLAYDPEIIHIIYSIVDHETKAFKVKNGLVIDERVEIIA